MRARAALAFALTLTAGLSACPDFDREDRIEDLRVLAVRTEPAELFYSPFFAFTRPDQRPPGLPLAGVDVDVEVYAFEPRGGLVTADVRLCPDGGFACVDYDPSELITAQPAEGRADLEAVYQPRTLEADVTNLNEAPAGRVPGLSFSFAFTPAVIDSLVPKTEGGDPLPSFFPQLPRVAVDIESLEHEVVTRETAFKRIPAGVDLFDPAVPAEFRAALGAGLGITLCDARIPDDDFEEGPAPCYEPRGPNQNPALLGFRILPPGTPPEDGVRVDTAESPVPVDIGPDSLLRVPRGGTLTLEPVFAEGARERYQVLTFAIEDSKILIENRREDLVATWFTTRGDLSDAQTDGFFDGSLTTTWALPRSGVAAGERDELIVVLRDQRGGTSVGRVTVVYR